MIFLHWHFYITYNYITASCIDLYTLSFLYYLHLYLFHHVLLFRHWHFYVTYIFTYFIMYLFLQIEAFILLSLINISECIDFFTLAFLCYLQLFLCHHVLIFIPWHFYVTDTYTYFITYWLLHIDIFMLLTLILISSYIDFYISMLLYSLHLHIFQNRLSFIHWHFYVIDSYL